MKIKETIKNNIVINGLSSDLNTEILIDVLKKSNISNKDDLIKEWASLENTELDSKDYEVIAELNKFKIKLIQSLILEK